MIQNIDLIQKYIPIKAVITNANNSLTINSAKKASELGLIEPILIGNSDYIKKKVNELNWIINDNIIVHTNNEKESAFKSCQLAKTNKISLIVKGHMHTDVLMGEYIKSEHSLRVIYKRLSHIWYMSFNNNKRNPLIITDGALNIKPSLETKKSIITNVVKFVEKIDQFKPKVAILSATEEALPQMESSMDAIKLVDWSKNEYPDLDIYGPLAFDNAISEEAASIKGIGSNVAGKANIIIVPNIETGNSLVKIMVNFMQATAGGFIVGGKVPVVITSRSDDLDSRLSSISNAILCIDR